MLPNELPIHDFNTEELWNHYEMEYFDKNIDEEEYKLIKYGKNIKFDIREYIRAIKGEKSRIIFEYINERVALEPYEDAWVKAEDFDNEIGFRKNTMRLILYKLQNTDIREDRRL